MPSRLLSGTGSFFDLLEQRWQNLTTQRRVVDASLGEVTTLFAIALTWVYNRTAIGEFEAPK